MKKIFIKYNPYNLETELTVDGKNLLKTVKSVKKFSPAPACKNGLRTFPKI